MADIQTQLPVRSDILDDSAWGIGTDEVFPLGALADETTPDSVDEGDIGLLRMTLTRLLKTKLIGDDSGTDVEVAVDSNGYVQVDITNTSLSVDDGGGSITVDDGGGAITVDGTVTVVDGGGSITVDGTVDISSVVPGTGATNLGKAEDAAHADGDVGVMALAVRNDTLAALAGADGDYAPLQVNADGALYVSGTFMAGNEFTDDSAFTVATDTVGAIGMLADDTTPDSVDEGDIGIPRMTLDRKQLMVITDATTDANRWGIDASGNGQVILAANSGVDIGDVDVTSVIPGTGATNLGKAEDAAHSSGDVGVMALFVRQDTQADFGADGDYVPGSIDADGALRVTVVSGGGGGITDDSAFGIGSDTVTPFGAILDDVSPDTVDEGDIGAVRMTANRILRVAPYPGSGGTPVHNYDTVASVADAAAGDIDYDRTGLTTTFYLKQIIAASSGAPCKVIVSSAAGSVIHAVGFYSTASPVVDITFAEPIPITSTATDAVTVSIENHAGTAQDVYATIIGVEL